MCSVKRISDVGNSYVMGTRIFMRHVPESKFYYAMLSMAISSAQVRSSKECLEVRMQGQWDLQGNATISAMAMWSLPIDGGGGDGGGGGGGAREATKENKKEGTEGIKGKSLSLVGARHQLTIPRETLRSTNPPVLLFNNHFIPLSPLLQSSRRAIL